MFELTVNVNPAEISAVRTRLTSVPGKVRKVLRDAANDTAKSVRAALSTSVRKLVNIKKKDLDRHLHIIRASGPTTTTAAVVAEKSARLPVKYFGARQTSSGVKFKISKDGKSKGFVASGFMGPKPGAVSLRLRGHAFVRGGKKRLPIVKLHGPSAWGVIVKNNITSPIVVIGQKELAKNIQRRLNLEVLRAQGLAK